MYDEEQSSIDNFSGTDQERFENYFARARLLNTDKREGKYVSKQTQEFWMCWRLAQS